MSEMIPFPDKEAQLLASGTRKMLAQDYLSAKKDFEKLYSFAHSFESVHQLIEDYLVIMKLLFFMRKSMKRNICQILIFLNNIFIYFY